MHPFPHLPFPVLPTCCQSTLVRNLVPFCSSLPYAHPSTLTIFQSEFLVIACVVTSRSHRPNCAGFSTRNGISWCHSSEYICVSTASIACLYNSCSSSTLPGGAFAPFSGVRAHNPCTEPVAWLMLVALLNRVRSIFIVIRSQAFGLIDRCFSRQRTFQVCFLVRPVVLDF